MWENDVLIHYVQSINPTTKFLFVNNYKQMVLVLDREDVVCVCVQRVGVVYQAKLQGKDYIIPLDHRILERNMGFKVSKESSEFAQMLNNGLEVILANGEYRKIYDKWIAELTNLMKNAVKFTHNGIIEIKFSVNDQKAEFWIKDTGIGIPQDKQTAIYERFVQAGSSQSLGYEGSGLGLSITKGYVQLLNGEITLESAPNNGTTFYVSIPNQSLRLN